MFYETRNGHGLPHDPFKAIIAPRPIGWISTVDVEGRVNLAPFSFYNAVADNPPQVIYAANGRKPDAAVKDSRANAEATGCFVVNLATWDLRMAMNTTAAHLPMGADEMKAAGLTAAPAKIVAAPRVAEAPVNLECRYLQTVILATDDPDVFHVKMTWGDPVALPEHTDGGAVERNLVAVTYLSRITAEERSDLSKPEAALANLLG